MREKRLRTLWRNIRTALNGWLAIDHGIERVNARIAKGFRFVTRTSDARILAAGSQQLLGEMRQR